MPKSRPAFPSVPLSPSAVPRFQIFATTAPGLESIAAGELKSLGVRGRQEVGGVAIGGDLDRIYQANLWLRTASRVLVRLGEFHASTFYELVRRSKKLPWADFLPETGTVEVRVTCRKSKLYHSDAVAERVLSAIANTASAKLELRAGSFESDDGESGELEETRATAQHSTQLFIVRIVNDQCEISADSSGELMHRRGYRKEIAKAPLRETLAAAMVLASGWDGKRGEPLLDPMCGSGTIPIEAALIARGIAPGLERQFQFMRWPTFDRDVWNELVDKARNSVTNPGSNIVGADRDAGAISAATHNAERARMAGNIRLSVESLSASIAKLEDVGAGEGWILTNPPYGVRVGEGTDLRDLYATLGKSLKAKHGWRLGLLTSDVALAGQMRLPLRPRFSTSNGGIPVSFLASEKLAKTENGSFPIGVVNAV
jgi:putative N6-adenine-specific DNA methylase